MCLSSIEEKEIVKNKKETQAITSHAYRIKNLNPYIIKKNLINILQILCFVRTIFCWIRASPCGPNTPEMNRKKEKKIALNQRIRINEYIMRSYPRSLFVTGTNKEKKKDKKKEKKKKNKNDKKNKEKENKKNKMKEMKDKK